MGKKEKANCLDLSSLDNLLFLSFPFFFSHIFLLFVFLCLDVCIYLIAVACLFVFFVLSFERSGSKTRIVERLQLWIKTRICGGHRIFGCPSVKKQTFNST
jgi:hypothetical protein